LLKGLVILIRDPDPTFKVITNPDKIKVSDPRGSGSATLCLRLGTGTCCNWGNEDHTSSSASAHPKLKNARMVTIPFFQQSTDSLN